MAGPADLDDIVAELALIRDRVGPDKYAAANAKVRLKGSRGPQPKDDKARLCQIADLIIDGAKTSKALTDIATVYPGQSSESTRHRLARKWKRDSDLYLAEARSRRQHMRQQSNRLRFDNNNSDIFGIADILLEQIRAPIEGMGKAIEDIIRKFQEQNRVLGEILRFGTLWRLENIQIPPPWTK